MPGRQGNFPVNGDEDGLDEEEGSDEEGSG